MDGLCFASATVTCSPTASAPTPRRGVGLIVKTASRSRAPNTWRGQFDWRHARLHGRPTRSVKDERDLRDRDAASRWLAKDDKPTAARKTRRRSECGENVTAPRSHDKALRRLVKEAKERLHPDPAVPLSQVEHHSIPRASCPRIPCCSYTTLESDIKDMMPSEAWQTVTSTG